MSNLEHTLERLALTFTVRDIMVHKDDLTYVPDEVCAQRLLEKHPEFDTIPIEQDGILCAYLERGAEDPKSIGIQDIISDTTRILDLVDILQERKFCFVSVNHSIAGYVHFSDLNNHIVKLPFFVLLEALETRFVEEVGPLINGNDLDVMLDQKRLQDVKDRMHRMRKKRSDLNWVNLLHFKEIVRFACHFGKVELEKKQIDVISKVRNLVCHADIPLVEEHKDVRRLSTAKRICLSILQGMTA